MLTTELCPLIHVSFIYSSSHRYAAKDQNSQSSHMKTYKWLFKNNEKRLSQIFHLQLVFDFCRQKIRTKIHRCITIFFQSNHQEAEHGLHKQLIRQKASKAGFLFGWLTSRGESKQQVGHGSVYIRERCHYCSKSTAQFKLN